MSTDRLTTSFAADLEVRGGDGRTVTGIAVPFDAPTRIGTMSEVFRHGAFARTILERGDRVKFMAAHGHGNPLPLGRASLLREDTAGLYGEFRVSATDAGDEMLELIRDGAVDSLSVGFRAVTSRLSPKGDLIERLEVALLEVSAVAVPAYDNARIVAVRSEPSALALEDDPTYIPPIAIAAARQRLGLTSTRVSTYDARRRFWRMTSGD